MFHLAVLPLLLAVSPIAPVPKAKPQPPYLSTEVGAKAVYRHTWSPPALPGEGPAPGVRPAKQVSTLTVVVTDVEKRVGATAVTLSETFEDKDQGSDTFIVSEKGVFNIQTTSPGPPKQSWKHDPPFCLLSFPHKVGNKWEFDYPAQAGGLVGVKGTKTAHGPEEVVVLAGKYLAIRVEHIEKNKGVPTPMTFWYAPGVGLVKMVSQDVVRELESFTPGKK